MAAKATGPSLWDKAESLMVAEVVVEVEAPDLLTTYSYRVPTDLSSAVQVGSCVQVPFGGREVLGYVLEIGRSPIIAGIQLRDIAGVIEGALTFSPEQAATARWLHHHTLCPMLHAVRCIVPAAFGARIRTVARLTDIAPDLSRVRSQSQLKIMQVLQELNGEADLEELKRRFGDGDGFSSAYLAVRNKHLVEEHRELIRASTSPRRIISYELNPAAAEEGELVRLSAGSKVVNWLRKKDQVLSSDEDPQKSHRFSRAELMEGAGVSVAVIHNLVKKGWLIRRVEESFRKPETYSHRSIPKPELTADQCKAVNTLKAAVDAHEFRRILLYGVTASGKTEVYLGAIEKALEVGGGALMLVPEIALTTQLVDAFVSRFGDRTAVLHSRLSEGERFDEWRRIQSGAAPVVVGARSAVFAPLPNVRLIILDEEHEPSYKQETSPRYHAHRVAEERARHNRAVLLLGSATPSIESFHTAQTADTECITMSYRVAGRKLPKVELVDLRDEFIKQPTLFSQRLDEEIQARIGTGNQIILLLNRRGFAPLVLCRACGTVCRCPNCEVALALHRENHQLRCHHCDYVEKPPDICPRCGDVHIGVFGTGTERVEHEVKSRYPAVRVLRLDRDSTTRKGAHAQIVRTFYQGEADILIGTQMVAKGLDFPNVTLVGVVSADTSLHMPDFRAAERTFQLLTQVAGRAGRGEQPGLVIVQSFSPDHYALQAAKDHDYRRFYEQEIAFREELAYPPFSRLANLVSQDETASNASDRCYRLAEALRRTLPDSITLIGPAPAPFARLRGYYRWRIALRAPASQADQLPRWIEAALAYLEPSDRQRLVVDMDPFNMA